MFSKLYNRFFFTDDPASSVVHQRMRDRGMLDEVKVNWYNTTKIRYMINYE